MQEIMCPICDVKFERVKEVEDGDVIRCPDCHQEFRYEAPDEVSRLRRQLEDQTNYSIHLQRAIEYHCRGEKVPAWVSIKCPHLARKLDGDHGHSPEPRTFGPVCSVKDPRGRELVLATNEHGSLVVYAMDHGGCVPKVTLTLHEETARFLRDWLTDQVRS
jgi:hypothetical protein